jgi:hypothetical protein
MDGGGVGFPETFAASFQSTWHHVTEDFTMKTVYVSVPYLLSGIFMKLHSHILFVLQMH